MSLLFRLTIDSRIWLAGFASALVWLWPTVAGAQVDDPTITVCNDCSSAFQYSHAAVQAAEFEFDGAFPGGTDEVYVVNVAAGQTLAYRVTRTMIDPDPFLFGDETFETTATPIDGEPALMFELADALQAIKDFHEAVIQDIPAEELDLPFDSALDLIGGSVGDSNRIRLQQAMEGRFNETFSEFAVHFNNFVRLVGGIFSVETSFPAPGTGFVRVNFPDGTTLRARVETAPDPTDNGVDLEFDVDVDPESIQGPNGEFIPLSGAHLVGFEFTTPDPGLSQEFQDLLRRLGADVQGPPPGGGGGGPGTCTTTSCVEAGVDDEGNPIFRCTQSISDC